MAKVAVIAGAGGVLGAALGREFLEAGYSVVALRRPGSNVQPDSGIHTLHCDLADAADTHRAVTQIIAEVGEIDVLVCNAAHLVMAPFAELTIADFENTWRTCVGGAIGCVQAALPGMRQRGHGALIFSGATASIRGAQHFAAFASAKFALRGLAQSLAREYQTQGIHVVHVVLDGLLRGSPSVSRFGSSDEQAMDPAEIAKTYRWLAEQDASTWAHEIDLRPGSSERF